MHARNRWRNWRWSAGFALVLAGCGQAEAPKVPIEDAPPAATPVAPPVVTPAVVESGGSTDAPAVQTAAKPASPASLEEATRVIDFRKFPLPDGGKDIYKSADIPKGDSGKDLRRSAAELAYVLRKGSAAQAAQYCRTQLAEAGWKLADGPDSQGDNLSFTGSKQGFFLTGYVNEDRAAGLVSVRITNHGNIDSRTLPRFPGAELSAAELKYNNAWTTNYQTDAKPDAVLEFMQAELPKAGWREVTMFNRRKSNEPRDPTNTRFIQRGIEIGIHVRDKGVDVKEGKIAVMNSVRLLWVELPIMPEAKGEVEYVPLDYYFRLFYAAPTGPEKVLEFYRKELPALGWTMRAGTDEIVDGKAKVMLDAPEKNSLRLELLADKEETLVLIANVVQEKQDAPKTEAKGTLTLGDNTYKLTKAFAYEVTRSNKKQTVVILSEKALDTAKVKQSLKKNGSDEDFFPFAAHVKLSFDDQGSLSQTAIYADGANIIGSGDDNTKATATLKDGTVKGKAGMEKPGTFFKKSYRFEVAFEVAVIQLPRADPDLPQPLDPKAKVKTKTTPDEAKKPALATDKELRFEGKLAKDSPKVMGKPAQIHRVKMSPDKTYIIDLESKDFDAYLRILDSNGKQLAKDDDSGGNRNARIRFTPPNEGDYQVVATRFGSGQGNYVLKIRILRVGEEMQP